jgi:hypothetical protein
MGGDVIVHGRYRHARRQIALCPIYEGPRIDTALEGFAFDYNYTNIGYVATQVIPYMFIGGRVCFHYPGVSGPAPQPWTALPMTMTCGPRPSLMGGTMTTMSMGFLWDTARAGLDWLYNSISFAFTYRSGRKYFYFKRGYKGIFSCGPFSGGD